MSTSNPEIATLDHDPEFSFRLIAFHPQRHREGMAAACVLVIVDGVDDDVQWLWEKDIRNYLEMFGEHTALRNALAHYAAAASSSLPSTAAA